MRAMNLSQRENYKWWVFAAVALGTLTSVINNGSVIVAVPTIAQHFGTDLSTVQWVVIAEGLTVSALLLPMGRLSDIVGRKQVYVAGLIIFMVAAALAGMSPNIAALIVFKGMQGIGAAMTQGTGLAMVTSVFPASERGKGIGTHASVVGTGGVIGPVAGGFLVVALGWRWVFFINIWMGLLTMIAVLIIIDSRAFRADTRVRTYDLLGAVLSSAALLTFLLAVTNGARTGWLSPTIVTAGIMFVILAAVFIWWQGRSPSPMLDLGLFKNRVFALGVATGFISFLGVTSVRFLLPFFLQAALGYSPGQVGLVMVPNAISRIIMGPLSGLLSDRYGYRMFNVAGLLLAASGLFVFSTVNESSSLAVILIGVVLQSSGSGMFQSPNNSSIFGAADPSKHGIVAALVNLTRNSANVTGVAVATAIVTAVMASQGFDANIDEVIESGKETGMLSAFNSGLHIAYLIMGSLLVVGALASLFKGRDRREVPESETPSTSKKASS